MTSNEKCGNVFLSENGKTIFLCTLCGKKYKKIEDFGIHMIDKHFTPTEDFEEDDLLPDISDIISEENMPDTEAQNELSFATDQEDSDSNSSSDEKTSVMEMLNDGQQCGEVNFTQEGIILFDCGFCDSKYEGVREFDKHIRDHFSKQLLEEVQIEMLWPEDDKNANFEPCNEIDTSTDNVLFVELTQHDNKTSLNAPQKAMQPAVEQKETKKPIPKWRQIFEIIVCPTSNEEKYKCKLCGVVIRHKSNVPHHIKRVHENHKPHKCPECSKEFHASTELRIHLRKHTGERPYLCVECGMSFISASDLHRHRERHHKKHIRDKICSICNKSFFTNRHLRAHESVHSEERPFKCNICNTGYKKRHTLKTHMRIHEDKRQYQCNICLASYNYKSILNSHLRNKHALAVETY